MTGNHNNPHLILLGATFSTGNLGVNVLTSGAIKTILAATPDARISILDYAKEPALYTQQCAGRTISVPLVNMRFSKKVYLSNNIAVLIVVACVLKLIPHAGLRSRIISRNRCLRHIQDADVVASLAGGDSFSDIYGMERLLYVSLPQILVLLLGKRLVLLPQTIGPFKSRLARAVARFIVRRADQAYSRDHTGVDELRQLAAGRDREDFRFCYDVGLVLDPEKPQHLDLAGVSLSDLQRPLIGLNVSGLLHMGGYTASNMFGLRCDYALLVRSIIRLLVTQKSGTVLLVPHVFGSHAESDETVCRKIYEELAPEYPGALGLVQGRYNQHEIKYIIGQCDFFIGSRMHACIAAVSQSVPAVSVAYSDKFAGVMQSLGLSDLVVDPRALDQGEILNTISRLFEDRSNIRRHLTQKMPEVRTIVLSLFQDLKVGQANSDIHRRVEVSDTVAAV